MKLSDIDKLRDAGLITDEQRQKIIEKFELKEDGGKFLAIISMIGAVLVVAGLVLLISANWEEIPRFVKIALGLALMLGAHAGGWWLREVHGKYRKSGEALHLIGSGLFLGNIALIGQIYHLSSRPPNAILLWWLGIAALPWLLRSKAQHILSLLAFGLWFGLEINESHSWFYFGSDQYQIILYALLGLIYLGLGHCLRRTSFAEFAGATQKLGLLTFHLFMYPLTWTIFYHGDPRLSAGSMAVFWGLAAIAAALLVAGLRGEKELTTQWRWTWGGALVASIGLMVLSLYLFRPLVSGLRPWEFEHWNNWIASITLFVVCLLQIQVGLQVRSPFMVNLGVTFVALHIFTTYLVLIGTMARTGVMFLVSGVFLIAFGIYLEKKRRALLQRMNSKPA